MVFFIHFFKNDNKRKKKRILIGIGIGNAGNAPQARCLANFLSVPPGTGKKF
jgi:hypothetical protein